MTAASHRSSVVIALKAETKSVQPHPGVEHACRWVQLSRSHLAQLDEDEYMIYPNGEATEVSHKRHSEAMEAVRLSPWTLPAPWGQDVSP